jgi:hypothetical protein
MVMGEGEGMVMGEGGGQLNNDLVLLRVIAVIAVCDGRAPSLLVSATSLSSSGSTPLLLTSVPAPRSLLLLTSI